MPRAFRFSPIWKISSCVVRSSRMRLPLSTADTGSPSALTKVRERIAHLRRFGSAAAGAERYRRLPTLLGAGGVLVAIMVPDPVHGVPFVAALGGEVEIIVRADEDVAAAPIGRIGVKDLACGILVEHADPGQFASGRAVRRLVIIIGLAGGSLILRGGDVIVVVEVVSVGRDPVE